MNIPNLISMLRVFMIPLFLYLILMDSKTMKILGLVVFALASLTDLIDGWSARKLKQESEFGKFLDPLADKILVVSGLCSFLLLDALIPIWMIIVIIGRDVLITVLRYCAIQKGSSLRTSHFGKVKTAFQMISIVLIIMIIIVRGSKISLPADFVSDSYFYSALQVVMSDNPKKWLIAGPYWIMLFVTIVTAWSGLRYLMFNWKFLLPPYKNKAVDAK